MLLEISGFGGVLIYMVASNINFAYIIILIGIFVLSLFVIVLVSSVLNTVLKVVLFEYANTKQAPENFDKSALAQAIVQKK